MRARYERPSRAPWGAALLITPHLILGTWLLCVPDHVAFRTSQVVTLLHVALAILSVPFVAIWITRHARRMEAARDRPFGPSVALRWLLATTVSFAMATGAIVTWGGDITPAHRLHMWCSLAVGVQLAWHLWAGGRRRPALFVAGLLLFSTVGAQATRRLLPSEPLEARVPAFEWKTRPTALYESAASCAECHGEDYDEWKRSTHARTMDNPLIRDGHVRQPESVGFDLAMFGQIIRGAPLANANAAIIACEMCHAPTSFFGDDKQDPLHATGTPAEGVTCSFCHTMRAVTMGEHRGERVTDEQMDPKNRKGLLPLLPQYVSAPETVRRYLGAGSDGWLGKKVSKLLIRWRPEVHRHDYHSPVLGSSLGCMPCHGGGGLDFRAEAPLKTYRSWETSRYNTGDPATTVTCQGCHLSRIPDGPREGEPGRWVPWGPVRKDHPSHLFVGGNRTVADKLNDEEFGQLEHELNLKAATVTIVGARRAEAGIEVDVRVASRLVGHDLPSMGAQNRWLWVEVSATDAGGRPLATTKPPESGEDLASESPVMFRCVNHPSPACDTLLQPDKPRDFTVKLKLDPRATPARLSARLHLSVDREPIAEDGKPFPMPSRPPSPSVP